MIDEKMRKEMKDEFEKDNREEALRLSRKMDKQINEYYNENPKDTKMLYNIDEEVMKVGKQTVKKTIQRKSNGDISSKGRKDNWRARDGGVRTIGHSISEEFIRKGLISFRDQKVETPGEMAYLAQVYRNPKFETLRIFYLKKIYINRP